MIEAVDGVVDGESTTAAGEALPAVPSSDVAPPDVEVANSVDVEVATEVEPEPIPEPPAERAGKPRKKAAAPKRKPAAKSDSIKFTLAGVADGDAAGAEETGKKDWYILKVQVNREDSIRDAMVRRIKIEGLERYFDEIVIPTEEVAEFTSGKRRVVKRKLYPGYILVHMAINDDTWFLVRETPGVGDFTGSVGKPTPMDPADVERILKKTAKQAEGGAPVKTAIPFKPSDRVRVKDGYFQNFEGEVETIDEANGRITVMINIFGRSTPVELEHWQVEAV